MAEHIRYWTGTHNVELRVTRHGYGWFILGATVTGKVVGPELENYNQAIAYADKNRWTRA